MITSLYHTISFRTLRRFSSVALPSSALKHDLVEGLRTLVRSGDLRRAVSLFYSAPVELQSQQAYAALFQACADQRNLCDGINLHHHMLSHSDSYSQSLVLGNYLITMYAKCGNVLNARQVFDYMPDRNVVSWSALISGYAQAGNEQEGLSLFSAMLAHCCPNEFVLSSVLTSCRYEHGKQVHGLALKLGLHCSVYVANALISMYGRCHDSAAAYEAWTVFEAMEFKNLVTWNSMIAAFQCCNLGKQAVGVFMRMHGDGVGFDRATVLNICSSLYKSSDLVPDEVSKCCLQVHSLTVRSGLVTQTQVATALVKVYSEILGEFDDCYKIFMEMRHCRDIVAWTGIITTFAVYDPEKAILFFGQLRHEKLSPDWYTFSSVLKACAGLVTARHALSIHAQVIKGGFAADTVLNNSLIHAYAKCGSLDLCKRVFDDMDSRDVVSWNSMLKAYSLHGQVDSILPVFQKMDINPDSATFIALLSACSHAGRVEEGLRIFRSMFEKPETLPQLNHYACVIDMLGRAERFAEAEEVIKQMPMEPDAVVWSALLGSCRKHGNTRLGKLAADKLKELEPTNIYNAEGSFTKANKSIKETETWRVRKEPGLSWTEIGNKVHEFSSGGRHRRPDREAICRELERLISRLKEIGYVPEMRSASQDIEEEEQKEEHLSHHSEKLALAFAVMEARKSGDHGVNLIQIIKNIRICIDCHNFMKLASKLLGKEILVRDSNRFHHFKDSSCSCNDYW
ncbi:PREDICTED: pentatricopeptide repeat-containing protein At1g71420 [Camelina sativa]|uniref:Pentatricopeptide repeat-containing protein At1g71420 n=1 Tax=Camelina sativa TaxID=90675 RepID=A0ABM0TL35_CAMSA|nr:PREDICTED: pentatricopeptide repeat-containing protein At1g71420 [Camelina sativa]